MKPQPLNVHEIIKTLGIAPKPKYRRDEINRQPGLSDAKKLLLHEIYALDKGNKPNVQGRFGCYASVASLADRLGRTHASVKAMLEELRAAGYVVTLFREERSRLVYRRVVLQHVIKKQPTTATLDNGKIINSRPKFVVESREEIGSDAPGGSALQEEPLRVFPTEIHVSPSRDNMSELSLQNGKNNWIVKVLNLPGIDRLWWRFDKSALDQRVAKLIHNAWRAHIINPAKLELVIDTIICDEFDQYDAPAVPVSLGAFIRNFSVLDAHCAKILRNQEKFRLKYSDARLAKFGPAADDARTELAHIAEDLEIVGDSAHAAELRQRREAIVAQFKKP